MQFSASRFVNSLQLGLLRAETGRKEGRAFGLDKWSLSNSTNRPGFNAASFLALCFFRLYMLNKTIVKFEICLLFNWQRCECETFRRDWLLRRLSDHSLISYAAGHMASTNRHGHLVFYKLYNIINRIVIKTVLGSIKVLKHVCVKADLTFYGSLLTDFVFNYSPIKCSVTYNKWRSAQHFRKSRVRMSWQKRLSCSEFTWHKSF